MFLLNNKKLFVKPKMILFLHTISCPIQPVINKNDKNFMPKKYKKPIDILF